MTAKFFSFHYCHCFVFCFKTLYWDPLRILWWLLGFSMEWRIETYLVNNFQVEDSKGILWVFKTFFRKMNRLQHVICFILLSFFLLKDFWQAFSFKFFRLQILYFRWIPGDSNYIFRNSLGILWYSQCRKTNYICLASSVFFFELSKFYETLFWGQLRFFRLVF